MCIFRDAVNHAGPEHYTPEQVQAWSAFGHDTCEFESWLGQSKVYVAIDSKRHSIGFAGLEASGRIASLFVTPGYMRQGIGSRLPKHILNEAAQSGLTQLTTEASEFSRPLFEAADFVVIDIEETCFKGVQIHRYRMARDNKNNSVSSS